MCMLVLIGHEAVNNNFHYSKIIISPPILKIRLIKICLSETYTKVSTGKHLSQAFPIQNCLKQGHALSPLLLNFPLEYASKKV